MHRQELWEKLSKNNPKLQALTEEERDKMFFENLFYEQDYESIDNLIFETEKGESVIDDILCINEHWEQYKEDVGYYKRHPEREEYSKNYTKMILNAKKKYWENKI